MTSVGTVVMQLGRRKWNVARLGEKGTRLRAPGREPGWRSRYQDRKWVVRMDLPGVQSHQANCTLCAGPGGCRRWEPVRAGRAQLPEPLQAGDSAQCWAERPLTLGRPFTTRLGPCAQMLSHLGGSAASSVLKKLAFFFLTKAPVS